MKNMQRLAKTCAGVISVIAVGMFISTSANAGNFAREEVHDDSYAPLAAANTILLCSASDSSSPTGRQLAIIKPSPRDPSYCVRTKLGGIADNAIVDCWKAARAAGFVCLEVVDSN